MNARMRDFAIILNREWIRMDTNVAGNGPKTGKNGFFVEFYGGRN